MPNAETDSIRNDVKEDSSLVLYEDHRYMISTAAQDTDCHHLLVNNAQAYLSRGIFREIARSNTTRLRNSLEMVGQQVLNEILTQNIPLEEVGWALAKAAIKDQEDYASYLSDQMNERG